MADETSDKRSDETVPGGKYLAGDGKTLVDANGNELKAEKPSTQKDA
jgi:hypothetical protein